MEKIRIMTPEHRLATKVTYEPTPPAHPAHACAVLLECYDDGAGAEALLRAFLAERDCDRPGAKFWISVYGLIAAKAKHS